MDPTKPPPPSADVTTGLEPVVQRHRPFAPGSTFGRYRDLAFLGSGGMATVYRAYDPTLARTVALKLIRGDDPQFADRLMVEARAQARIEHEHVCRIYEVGEEGGRPYIAMQFVEGGTLKDWRDEFSLEQKLKIMKEVAEGVHAAHRVGFIHRDLKPANVMVERAGDGGFVPYVMDFGLAREAAAPGLTATGVVMGTPWYMSPEQARGDSKALDRRSDVYSLGATLYELLAGSPPFDSDSSIDVLVKLLSHDPVPVGRPPSAPAGGRADDRDEVPGEGAGPALRLGPGPRRRPRALPGGRAHPRARQRLPRPRDPQGPQEQGARRHRRRGDAGGAGGRRLRAVDARVAAAAGGARRRVRAGGGRRRVADAGRARGAPARHPRGEGAGARAPARASRRAWPPCGRPGRAAPASWRWGADSW